MVGCDLGGRPKNDSNEEFQEFSALFFPLLWHLFKKRSLILDNQAVCFWWCDLRPPASLSLQTFSWGLLAAVTSDGTAGLILDAH